MGYAGGQTADPTYHNLGDHTETLQLDFNPEVVSYQDLLNTFWLEHRPLSPPWSRQYMSAIFCHDAQQMDMAHEVKSQFETRWGASLHTEIRPHVPFYRAEDYHQKYRLQRRPAILNDLQACYPDFQALVDSPTAARLNAFLGGALSKARLGPELAQFGLAPETQSLLTKAVK